MYIRLTKGRTTIIDDVDSDLVRFKWRFHGEGYAVRWGKRDEFLALHRVILERVIRRKLEDGEYVDHISGNGLDNRRNNLRVATASQNQANRGVSKSNTSGYKGVHFYKPLQKWVAYIRINYKRHHLGYFATPEEAAKAYNEAAIKHNGEFARLNNIKGLAS